MIRSITKEEFKAEAIKMMEVLNLAPFIIDEFKKDNTLYCSDVHPPAPPSLTALTPELKAKTKWIEKETHGMVYHIIKSTVYIWDAPVEMYSFAYISPYRETWELDECCIQDNILHSYVWSKTWDTGNKNGVIEVANIDGILLRTA